MRNGRCERRPLIRDHDGFVLMIMIAHNRRMCTIYRRVGWFKNYLEKKDLHGYNCSISNHILCFLTSHISSIFRYNHIWLVITCLTDDAQHELHSGRPSDRSTSTWFLEDGRYRSVEPTLPLLNKIHTPFPFSCV
jgi:hypothetical protein